MISDACVIYQSSLLNLLDTNPKEKVTRFLRSYQDDYTISSSQLSFLMSLPVMKSYQLWLSSALLSSLLPSNMRVECWEISQKKQLRAAIAINLLATRGRHRYPVLYIDSSFTVPSLMLAVIGQAILNGFLD